MESPTNRFLKMIGSFFLSVLIVMLMIAFLPGESENAFFSSIFNQTSQNAGMVGDEVISNNFFKLARKSCIYRYEQYGSSVANNEIINDCAYDTAQSLMIADRVSQSLGFDISSKSVREDLSKQANLAYKDSLKSAGYGSNDVLNPAEIYKKMIIQLPLDYRIKEKKVSSLYNGFLISPLEDTESQLKIKEDIKTLNFDLDVLYISNKTLNESADKKIDLSKESLMKMYEEELKSKKTSKDNKVSSFAERQEFLKKKKLLQERNTKIDEVKQELKEIVKKSNLDSIKNSFKGSTKISINEPLTSIWNLPVEENKSIQLGKNNDFIKDIINFEENKLKGPYSLENGLVFVQFKKIQKTKTPLNIDLKEQININENTNNFIIIGNIYQYFTKKFPIYRQEQTLN